jgi:hypothetical protein
MLLLSSCVYPVRQLTAIVYPWRDDGKASAVLRLRWCLHLLLWSSLLAGLWYLNRWGSLERLLRSSWPTLHHTWLPLLGLLVYLLGWLSRGLWLSLQRDPLSSVWPDLDVAWKETLTGLERAKIDVRTTPLFLILGPLTPDVHALLKSLGAACISQRANDPFHVFAQPQAVFVVCHRLSQLGMHGAAADVNEPSAARLHHLGQLLTRDRAAQVPVQGIVLVVPFAATQSRAATRKVVAGTQNDLRVLRQATGLEVPLYLAVSGLDLQADGMNAAAAWFQRFPPLPDLDPAEVQLMFQEGVDRFCLEQIAGEIRSQFRLDLSTSPERKQPGELPPNLRENIRLYRWLCAIRAWRTNLGQLLVEGTRNDYSEPGMVAGCYVLPTGGAKAQTAAMAKALTGDMLANQRTVCWTAETIAAHTEQRRRTWLGYSVGLLGVFAILAAVGWFFIGRS